MQTPEPLAEAGGRNAAARNTAPRGRRAWPWPGAGALPELFLGFSGGPFYLFVVLVPSKTSKGALFIPMLLGVLVLEGWGIYQV